MINAVAAGTGVLRVHGFDKSAGELEVVGRSDARKIGGQEPGRSRLGASAPNVARELTKPSVR